MAKAIMRLTDYLAKENIRPRTFAGKLGVSPSTITRVIRGERKPGLGLMRRIADATNNTVSKLDDFEVELDAAKRADQ